MSLGGRDFVVYTRNGVGGSKSRVLVSLAHFEKHAKRHLCCKSRVSTVLNTFILHAKHGVRFKSRVVELSDFFERHAKPAGEFFSRVTVRLGYLEYTRYKKGRPFRV